MTTTFTTHEHDTFSDRHAWKEVESEQTYSTREIQQCDYCGMYREKVRVNDSEFWVAYPRIEK